MTAQLDLFGASIPAPPPPAVTRPRPQSAELIPPPRTLPWAKLLRDHSGLATTILITCHDLYTGIVLESLLIGPERQFWLMHDHTIQERIGRQAPPGRHVFLSIKQGIAFHAAHPLIWMHGGTKAGFYRLAEPGEAAPADLQVPPMTLPYEVA